MKYDVILYGQIEVEVEVPDEDAKKIIFSPSISNEEQRKNAEYLGKLAKEKIMSLRCVQEIYIPDVPMIFNKDGVSLFRE